MAKERSDRREAAEEIAIAALSYLAGQPEQLGRFLAVTGIGPQQLRTAAAQPGFLAGVLEHFGSDEALLRAFADEVQIDPVEIVRARIILSGPTWERDAP
jgi:Protein of unknown function (DUF3572)